MDKTIRTLKVIANLIAAPLAVILPVRIKNAINLFNSFVYSSYYSKAFKSCGKDFFIRPPLHMAGSTYITIGNNFYAGYRLRIEAIYDKYNGNNEPILSIGNNVSFNYDCHLGCSNHIFIGDNVLFASRIFITDHYHGEIDYLSLATPPNKRQIYSKGPVIIEDNVWIGEGVAIMPNVTIGKNSIIGANSVVTSNIPENSVVGGIPARVIRTLIPKASD